MKKKIWLDQATRQKKFPPNMIAFYQSENVAAQDAMIFQKFKDHRITLTMAKNCIASNNFLEEVTEEQFMNEFKRCGYTTPIMHNIEQDIKDYSKKHKEVEE